MSRARIVKNTEALQQQAAATLRASMNSVTGKAQAALTTVSRPSKAHRRSSN